jgi:arabinan endo-1,5-alpha-L-arabinosidase
LLALWGFALVACGGNDDSGALSSAFSSVASSSSAIAYNVGTYENVILPVTDKGAVYTTEIADPSIVKGDDGYYYVFSTLRRCLRSADCCEWSVYSNAIIDRPTWGDDAVHGTPEVWAPDVIKIGDTWIYYYALSAWGMPCAGIGYATALSIGGPYVDHGKLCDKDDVAINDLIDPCPIVDNGRVFLEVGSFAGNFLLELTADGKGLLNGAAYQKEHKILIAGYDDQSGADLTTYEGGYLIQKDGSYYFFGSAGSCCDGASSSYKVYAGKAASVTGPYYGPDGKDMAGTMATWAQTTRGRLVIYGGTGGTVAGPGHNSVLRDDRGDYWIIYHCYCDYDKFATRHLFMDKLLWDPAGFPYVKGVKPSYEAEQDGPSFFQSGKA